MHLQNQVCNYKLDNKDAESLILQGN